MSETLVHDVIEAAIALTPHIRAARDELDAGRRLPPSLVAALARAGCLQLYLPRAMGGPQCPPLTVFRVIEELSRADGSVGWCSMIATATALFSGWLRPAVGQAMFGHPPDARVAGSLRPEGQAYPVDGGYRIRGRWDFASGINHANWLLCTCTIMAGETPRRTPAGMPETRSLMIPAAQADDCRHLVCGRHVWDGQPRLCGGRRVCPRLLQLFVRRTAPGSRDPCTIRVCSLWRPGPPP